MRPNKLTYLIKRLLASFLILILFSCDEWSPVPDFEVDSTQGYIPVYASESEMDVSLKTSREVSDPGKIYVINSYLLLVDRGTGVHIFNNSDTKNPVNLGFLQISGNNDVAIRDNILYADRGQDLLAIDISDLNNVKLAATIKNVFPIALKYPPVRGTYYECPDPAKGVVVGWENAIIQNPKCYR